MFRTKIILKNSIWLGYYTLAKKTSKDLCPCAFSARSISLSKVNATTETSMNVFSRDVKRMQRNRTAKMKDYKQYDYLREDIGWRMADRISDVKRKFNKIIDLGSGRGYISKHVHDDMAEKIYQVEMAEELLKQASKSEEVETHNVLMDEEKLDFEKNSIDLVISSLSLHWVNDLPGCFLRVMHCLKPDGCFMGAMFGGDTLFELRVSLQLAETELEGGFAPHISPFTSVQDLGNLLNRAGFKMLTIDVDDICIGYPGIMELMKDLQGMGESNCSWSRKPMLHRKSIKRAAEIYKEMYKKEDDPGIPATYQIIYFVGWKPGPLQASPLPRGSGNISLKDLDKAEKFANSIADSSSDDNVKQLSRQIERLKQSLTDGDVLTDENSDKKK